MDTNTYFFALAGAAALLAALFILDRRVFSVKKAHTFRPGITEAGIFLAAFLVFFLLNNGEFVWYNNYSYLADALLHGRLYVDGMPEYLESVQFGGHTYMHFAPGPALLCLPFVALFGINGFNIAWLSIFLGAGNAVLFYRVLLSLGIGRNMRERLWCTAAAVFGTVHCFLAAVGHSWFLGHVSSWFFLLLGMVFLTKSQRGGDTFLSGLFYGFAVTCRMANLPGAVFFGGYILLKHEKKRIWKSLLLFAAGAAVFGGLYMLYDYARYGTIMDKSYNLTHLKDYFRALYDEMQALPASEQLAFLNEAQKDVGGPLSLQYVGYNLYSIFLLLPEFTAQSPYVIPTLSGVSLTVLSPSLFFAARAPLKKERLHRFTLLAAVLCAIPFLLNYGNGAAQFSMRYAMDFLPYILLLSSAALTRKPLGKGKVLLILYGIFMNLWGPLYWRAFYL